MTDDEIKQLIASNAKAIEALSNAIAEDRKALSDSLAADREERRQQRSQLYQYLGRIAAAQSNFYEVQSDYYHQLAALSERQTRTEEQIIELEKQIVQILKHLSIDPQDNS